MSALSVPLDYELLTESGQLKSLLQRDAGPHLSANPRQIEALAEFITSKLFRKLGYLARSTNRPGVLTAIGAQQFRESVEPLFGEDCDVVKLLVEAGWLIETERAAHSATAAAGVLPNQEWKCPLFANLNAHLAGDFRPKHLKGNDGRQATIAIQKAAMTGPKQAEFLPDMFKPGAPGEATPRYEGAELNRIMIIISSIDNIMEFGRQKTQYTPELFHAATAAGTACNYTATIPSPEFRSFLTWLNGRKDSAIVPRTTEEILGDFKRLFDLSRG